MIIDVTSQFSFTSSYILFLSNNSHRREYTLFCNHTLFSLLWNCDCTCFTEVITLPILFTNAIIPKSHSKTFRHSNVIGIDLHVRLSPVSCGIIPFHISQHLKSLVGHTGGVWCSQFDGSTIVSGSTDRTLRVRPTANHHYSL